MDNFKSVPRDHSLSLLGKPRDEKRKTIATDFSIPPHTHDRFSYTYLSGCSFQVLVC